MKDACPSRNAANARHRRVSRSPTRCAALSEYSGSTVADTVVPPMNRVVCSECAQLLGLNCGGAILGRAHDASQRRRIGACARRVEIPSEDDGGGGISI